MIYYEVICNVLEPNLVVRRRKERVKSLGDLIDLLQQIEEMKKLHGDIEFVRVEKIDTRNEDCQKAFDKVLKYLLNPPRQRLVDLS